MTPPAAVLGRTGQVVSKLGFGSMQLHSSKLDPAETALLLNSVLDTGINVIDTSPDYGFAEEYIGSFISHRRNEFFLASKCGCPVAEGIESHDFTRENVRAAVEQSLRRMRTDHLDLIQFHLSLSADEIFKDDSIAELHSLRDKGMVRFIGMSGTLPNLPDQIALDVFDTFLIPYSLVEREHEDLISAAAKAGAGTLIRGGVARGLRETRAVPEPYRSQIELRRQRFEKTDLSDLLNGRPVMELLLRFTISHPDLHTVVVGTKRPEHLAANAVAVQQGPLPSDVYEEMKRRFA
jgi:aryl-alcohol dehydrogenase-like predicted oxidoreductase